MLIWTDSFGTDFDRRCDMVKEIIKLASTLAILAAVVVGVKYADKLVKEIKGEIGDEDIIDI